MWCLRDDRKKSMANPAAARGVNTTASTRSAARFSGRLTKLQWRWGVAVIALAAFLIAAGIEWLYPYAPRIHDEFSKLLSADTLLHGRLSNPTPQVWQPLQSFHVIMQPAYAAKYPIGPGLLIAAGWLLLGSPIASSWLAVAACSASVAWCARAVVPRRWALFAGLLVALHPALQTNWSQSLVHGYLPAIGSALLTGGVLRLRRGWRGGFEDLTAIWLAGYGVGLMAISRPFEGLVCTASMACLAWFLWSPRSVLERCRLAVRCSFFASPPVLIALALTVANNQATTGQWSKMPYQIHEHEYAVAPLFIFQSERTPAISETDRSRTISRFHSGWSLDSYHAHAGLTGYLQGLFDCGRIFVGFWSGPLWLVPLVSIGLWWRFSAARGLAIAVVAQCLASCLVCWVYPHYLAPILPWLVLLSVLGLQRFVASVRDLESRRKTLLVTCMAIVLLQGAGLLAGGLRLSSHPARAWALQRQTLVERLEHAGGQHLVLVRYEDDHDVHAEWVYNMAEPENASVLWARDERADWTERLLKVYGPGRQVWRVEPDADHVELKSVLSDDN